MQLWYCFFLLITFSFEEIKKLLTKEQKLARVAPFTGPANSRAFEERTNSEISRYPRAHARGTKDQKTTAVALYLFFPETQCIFL